MMMYVGLRIVEKLYLFRYENYVPLRKAEDT